MVYSRIEPPSHSILWSLLQKYCQNFKSFWEILNWVSSTEMSGKVTQLIPCFYNNQCLYWGLFVLRYHGTLLHLFLLLIIIMTTNDNCYVILWTLVHIQRTVVYLQWKETMEAAGKMKVRLRGFWRNAEANTCFPPLSPPPPIFFFFKPSLFKNA